MIHDDPEQYEAARWCEKDRMHYKQIRVGIVAEREKRYGGLFQNLTAQEETTVLKTDYGYPYAAGQELYYRGAWWAIRSVGSRSADLNPQAMALVNPACNMQYVLEVMRVE